MSIKIIRINSLIVTSFIILTALDNLQEASPQTSEVFRPADDEYDVQTSAHDFNNRPIGKTGRKKSNAKNDTDEDIICSCHGGSWPRRSQFYSFATFWPFIKIQQYLKYIANTYPNRTKLSSLGTTLENRTIYVMTIGVGIEGNNIIFITAGMYAKEWNGIMMALYVIHALVECGLYEKIGFIDWMIVPVANPDGYVYSFTHPKQRMWVKNRKPCQNLEDREKCEEGQDCGVNIDKNFQFMFPGGVGSSGNPCSDFYPGTVDGSEIESKKVMDILSSLRKQIKLYLGIRTYGSLIIYPYAAGISITVDNPQETVELAQLAIQAINDHIASDELYTYGSYATRIVPETGTSLDYAKGTLQLKYAFYIHLRGSHQPAKQDILPIISECFYGICAMVRDIYDKYPPPKKFLRKWKGYRRRRRLKNATEANRISYYVLGTILMEYLYILWRPNQ